MAPLETHDLNDTERAWLIAYVDEEVAVYRSVLTATALAAMRDALFDALLANPGTRELIRRLAPSPTVDASGTNALDRAALLDTEAEARRRAGGK